MIALSIDTATEVASIALYLSKTGSRREETVTWSRDGRLRHVEQLMPTVSWLCASAEVAPADIELVVCSGGPGSFTGLRIGVATAKGVVAASNAHLIAVSTLDALAEPYAPFHGLVVPVIDARKRRYYSAVYRRGEKLTRDLDIAPGDLEEQLRQLQGRKSEPVYLAGPHAAAALAALENSDLSLHFLSGSRSGAAAAQLRLGLDAYARGEFTAEDAGPTYVRGSDAEMAVRRSK